MRRSGLFSFAAAAFAATTTAVAIVAYRNALRRAAHTAARGGSLLWTQAGPIEYAEAGAGPPLLAIHGAGGGYDQGLDVTIDLVGDGFRVIAPSRFGYLRTPVPKDASPAAQADAHAALLAALDVKNAIVVGISAGARSAVELALRRPKAVSALILMVPGLYSPTSPVRIEGGRGSRVAYWLVNAGADFAWWLAEKIAPDMLIRFIGVRPEVAAAATPSEKARLKRLIRSLQPLSQRFAGVNVDSAEVLHELPLDKIAAPTLVISARDDLFNTLPAAEHAASRIPGARLVVYDTGGHLLIGHDADVRAEVDRFLKTAAQRPKARKRA